jgi:K+-transporting ATPase c subunit
LKNTIDLQVIKVATKRKHSTESVNLLVTDHILNAVDEKKVNVLVLLDLSKAFDGIDHDYGGRRPKPF